MNRNFLFSLFIAGISLGTAWAIRGQFGHEQGAAWAGGIGALSIILLAKRQDWYNKAFHLTLASAAGWGIGGIISYGIVVGYGRGIDFGNVYYGLLMLFIIGGLFGLLGGGLFGLMLADNPDKPVKWHQLIVEMVVSAIVFYYLLIEELGWLMTPPRSEAWAACFGMCVALFWYMIRNEQYAALRVAIFTGFGAGFGFAFGNFLQILGNVSGVKFNFWNVMEYSIGFFGGIGMAYGTFTSVWISCNKKISRNKLLAPLIIIVLIIPFVVWDQSFEKERLVEMISLINPVVDGINLARNIQWSALFSVLIMASFWLYYFYFRFKEKTIEIDYQDILRFFFSHFGLYTFLSILITGAFLSTYRIEQYLYIVNILVIYFLINRFQPQFSNRGFHISRWTINLLFTLAIIALFAIVTISSHGELKGAQVRFK